MAHELLFSSSSLHRLDIEVRDDPSRCVTIDPELADGAFSVPPLYDLSESGLTKRSLKGFKIVEKGTRVTAEKPIDPVSSAYRLGGDHLPKGLIVVRVGLHDLFAIVPDQAKRPSRLEQSMEFPKDRRAGLDGEAVEHVVRKDGRARPVVERQRAPKVAPQIQPRLRPTVHVDPSGQAGITAPEVE
jgi:hypothetical protein